MGFRGGSEGVHAVVAGAPGAVAVNDCVCEPSMLRELRATPPHQVHGWV
jgi:hypothetical protein